MVVGVTASVVVMLVLMGELRAVDVLISVVAEDFVSFKVRVEVAQYPMAGTSGPVSTYSCY